MQIKAKKIKVKGLIKNHRKIKIAKIINEVRKKED
jgi:hypothetical protein